MNTTPRTPALRANLLFIFALLFLSAHTAFAYNGYDQEYEDGQDKTLSPYFVVLSDNPDVDGLPLKETSVKADIVGVIADVTVKQVYVNSGKNTLEAIYTFPLSTRAAVYGMQMTIGTRVLTAHIEEKEKARKEYEEARAEGKRTSLLEQNRPNVFTMNVANIAPGDTIIVELKYTELLIPEGGKYSFVYPTVVGPRYSKKSAGAEVDDGFVASPYTKSGVEPTYKYGFELNINSGIPIQSVSCKTHKMNITHPNLDRAVVRLDPSETNGGNRDVIVDYSLQGDKIESGVMLYEGENENFFLMMIQPPKKVLKEDIPPREYVFIVDVSGSMEGTPLDITKTLLRNLITNLNPTDKFNVILFSFTAAQFRPLSVDANQTNMRAAFDFIDEQRGGGSTEILDALRTSFAVPRYDEDVSRSFIIITDGYVDVEREAMQMIRENSNDANVFSFGIGSSVNRYLIEGMAFMGGGEPLIITQYNEADDRADKFRNYINTPVLTRIKMDYGSFQAYDVEPVSIPDMLAERPIIVFGKYKGEAKGKVTLSGKVGRKTYKQTFDLSKVKPSNDNAAIRYLWARERIKLLDYYTNNDGMSDNLSDGYIKQITDLGLKYNLMTNYTSFIVIDEEIVEKDGELVRVKQPLPMPEGVSDYAVGFALDEMVMGIEMADMKFSEMIVIEEVEEDEIYNVEEVDEEPQFPGGENALYQFVASNLKYPIGAAEKGIKGTVVLFYVVNEDGSISDIEIIQSVHELLDNEAIRVLKLFPKMIPGKKNGEAVKVYYTLPVEFRL